MTITEKLEEIKESGLLTMTLDKAVNKEAFKSAEREIVTSAEDVLQEAKVTCKAYGTGTVVAVEGDNFEDVIINITFGAETKRFSLLHVIANKFVCFEEEAVLDSLNQLYDVHKELFKKLKELEAIYVKAEYEEKKKVEAEKQAEAKFAKHQEKSIKDFNAFIDKLDNTASDIEEFYYALGWLAKYVNTVSAALPDYLVDSFIKHFGPSTPCRVVDSKHRGPAGWQSQWSWSFKASLKKHDSIPSLLVPHLSPDSKAITDTSFVWTLVDTYGFQFGKKQEIEKIKQEVPTQFLSAFEEGFTS